MKIAKIEERFKKLMPRVDFCSLRYHIDREEEIFVHQDVLQPIGDNRDEGIMITVHHKGGIGYGATSDLRESGIKAAIDKAISWAEHSSKNAVTDFSKIVMPVVSGEYKTKLETSWDSISLKDKIDRLKVLSHSLKVSDSIVDWHAGLWRVAEERLYLTNHGSRTYQDFSYLFPVLGVSANKGSETISRSFSGGPYGQQGGYEILDYVNFDDRVKTLPEEALQLLDSPNCPTGTMDILLAPDQMILQIHESIGHPLELDRILGDERNYAGTSFVTQDMFGSYQYGSDLLNITFDPTIHHQVASYGFDDEGKRAEKSYLIENGLLKNPLGGDISSARSDGLNAVANSRSMSWKKPAMDRMANLNLEVGDSSLNDMISSIEKGVYMKSNSSWSIDDSRNKFQFGCEWGQLIENGELTTVVKNPNYRGISASFWRNLKMVGDEETYEVLGTPYCGKGEPNQVVRVGHATPACVFSDVAVFGGE